MYRTILSSLIVVTLWACGSPAQFSWQDSYKPPRFSVDSDLETCKAYTANQYQPGMPAGTPYLVQYGDYPHGNIGGGEANGMDSYQQGEWRPDRNPSHNININGRPTHLVKVDYTGYPGELDYYPEYLDDILEKCMLDRGWEYRPMLQHK